jgi:Xaa-Pro aminopeptidase
VNAPLTTPELPDLDGLPPMDVAARAERLRAALGRTGCETLLVTSLTHVRWLTGFTGSAARLVVLPDELVVVTDGRYGDQATAEVAAAGADARVVVGRSHQDQRDRLGLELRPFRRVGLEAAHVSWADQQSYVTVFPDAELVATTGLLEALRLVKDPGELARIEAAADLASIALAEVADLLDDDPTEAELAWALDAEMRRLGADGPSFDTIVATGPNASLPHHRPDATRIRDGHLVVLDFGALVDGYHSDMTRTAVVGSVSAEQQHLLDVVLAAQAAGVAAVGAGVAARDVDAACRRVIGAAGWGEHFTHGTGHGVGLQIHEAPWLNTASDDVLVAGAVLTVEPGVYLGPLGGARVEDAVLVTNEGSRILTKTPKDLSCLRSPRTT